MSRIVFVMALSASGKAFGFGAEDYRGGVDAQTRHPGGRRGASVPVSIIPGIRGRTIFKVRDVVQRSPTSRKAKP